MSSLRRFSLCFLLAAKSMADGPSVQAPSVAGGGGFHVHRPELYRKTWIDLNKNGVEDPYENPGLPIDARVNDLLGRMTLAEKIGQLEQQKLQAGADTIDAKLLCAGGLGSYLGTASDADLRNRLQRGAVEDSRLGIPLIFGFDTIHGFQTIFPIPLALSCAWDPGLLERTEAASAAESAAVGIDWVFAPMVDVARDPRWGRVAEGFGEDPWLASRMSAAAVRGFQGSNLSAPDRVAACLKHYVGYGAAEGGRDYNATEIGLPTLRNIYFPPFRAGVDAGAATIMSAFSTLDGIPASANHFTLTEVLRNEWRFKGFVVSDWNSVLELIHQGYAADRAQAAQMAVEAGVDMEMASDCYGASLAPLVAQGRVSLQTIDRAVARILRVKLQKGLFDRPYTGALRVDRAAARSLAREAAIRSCVLLKNDSQVLPLALRGGTVALIGPLADNRADLLGTWSGRGRAEDVVTLREGLVAKLPGVRFDFAKGCDLPPDDARLIPEAVAAARKADLVVLALGEPADWSGENKFRSDLGLPGHQQELFDSVSRLGKPVIVVLFGGRPLAIAEVMERASAVLMAWAPGVEAGPAVADLLTGAAAPSGRLTTSFPRSVGQVPVYYDCVATGREFADYKDGPRAALLPFGFGLTYSSFEYSGTAVRPGPAMGTFIATASIANTGRREGTEVVQLYLHANASSAGVRPIRELKGFQRVTLPPGRRQSVSFTVMADELGWWTADGIWKTEPGRYQATIAPNSAAGRWASFEVK